MSTEQFNVMRKELVENVTGAAQDWLAYMGTGAALAAIPDTEPPRYVVAGMLADIVKLLPAAEVIRPTVAAPASPEQVQASIDTPEFRELLAQTLDAAEAAENANDPSLYVPARTNLIAHIDAMLAAPIAAAPAAPTLTDEEITGLMSDIYLSDYYGKGTQAYDIAIVRAALAALAKKSTTAAATEEVRNQALEDAATVCEAERVHVHKWHPSSSGDEAYNAGCDDSAAAIRAMKRPASTEGGAA